MQREIKLTADGSHTIAVPGMNVTYHSHHGAVSESTCGCMLSQDFYTRSASLLLRRRFLTKTEKVVSNDSADENQQVVTILEIGFGTGS
jgi:hypothetical protein